MGSQSEHVPLRRWDPERIGPYAVLGRLGSGSMGQVFLGRSAAGRLVAVKTIRPELAEEAGFRTRFAQEVAAARKVSGVFTASVVEADPEADIPWLATAYVAAPSLSRLVLAGGPLPADSVRWLAAGCAEALASIHAAGLVHRDLKPSNVLVAPDGPRVIDFGVARAAERMGRTTSRGAVGTPAYMAPEQARDTREASVASDVYSLGATLLFAATGHPPHSGASVMDVLARLATEEPDLSGLPDELFDLIAACLDRVPRNRPTSTAMLVQLGDFTVAQAGPDEDHPYLPDAAMALITQYQRSPQFVAQAGPGEEDSTSASYTELPASYKPRPRRPPKGAGIPGHQGSGRSGAGWKGWLRTHLAWAGWASVGAALIVAGVILGASLTSSSTQNNSRPPAPPGQPVRIRRPGRRRHVRVHEQEPGLPRYRVRRRGPRVRPADHADGHGLRDRPGEQPAVQPDLGGPAGHRLRRDVPGAGRAALPRFAAAGAGHRHRDRPRRAARSTPSSW